MSKSKIQKYLKEEKINMNTKQCDNDHVQHPTKTNWYKNKARK